MGSIQKIMIDGKNYVLLSEEDYEDLVDGLQADAVMARIAAGEETWPHHLIVELANTNSRIRTYRTYRGMTINELAEAAGISAAELADLESSKDTGSVDVLTRIAVALRVDFDDLVVVTEPDDEE